jgi:hypothetical protein
MVNKPLELKEEFKLTRTDLLLVPGLLLGFALWIYFNIYSAINWDDLQYMSQAQYTFPDARILNRYGHIYIMKLFYTLAGSPITGARIFWCFMFFSTSVLTYWSAKLLAGKKGAFSAVMAVVLLWIWPLFGREAGSPLADFTVMMLVSAAVFIYLYFLKERTKYTHWFIMLLGFIFLWAVKSKESGVCLIVLFLGLGRSGDNFSFKRFIKDLCWVLAGIIVGLLILMSLDLIFMGNFLFSIKPSSFEKLAENNIGPPVISQNTDAAIESWFSYFTTRSILLVFVLYLLIGWSNLKNHSFRERILWITPLFLMIFLTFARRAWYIVPRYFSPVMPIMAIWASQFFLFDTEGKLIFGNNNSISKKAAVIIAVIAAFILALLFSIKIGSIAFYYKFYELAGRSGFPNVLYELMSSEEICSYLIVLPVAISGILITAALSKKRGVTAFFFYCLFSFALILPAFNDGRNLMRTAVEKSWKRFAACRAFQNDFRFTPQTKIAVSKVVFYGTWSMSDNMHFEADCYIFNIFFKQKLKLDQFIKADDAEILKGDYDYCLLLEIELQKLRAKPEFSKIASKFTMKTADVVNLQGMPMTLVLLINKELPIGKNL